jgi:hypothetical protein
MIHSYKSFEANQTTFRFYFNFSIYKKILLKNLLKVILQDFLKNSYDKIKRQLFLAMTAVNCYLLVIQLQLNTNNLGLVTQSLTQQKLHYDSSH